MMACWRLNGKKATSSVLLKGRVSFSVARGARDTLGGRLGNVCWGGVCLLAPFQHPYLTTHGPLVVVSNVTAVGRADRLNGYGPLPAVALYYCFLYMVFPYGSKEILS